MALESGRYMETVGWLSKHPILLQKISPTKKCPGAKLDQKGSTGNITFSRRYLDPNRVTYEASYMVRLCLYSLRIYIKQYHTGVSSNAYDTAAGQSITQGLDNLAESFDLDFLFGTAPQDYTLSRCVRFSTLLVAVLGSTNCKISVSFKQLPLVSVCGGSKCSSQLAYIIF
jgi:hypothetical protein